eukprot:TRINITY_DN15868_c0_g1_i2.p1 TRINITY_DN15868_c0_g1~~TRINITY_DN15868_c0_g1_i2.p1  ORF type:complete len:382 (+),score=42.67 TRINITY_DN15868_c0_g1_i2:94-1239(+)
MNTPPPPPSPSPLREGSYGSKPDPSHLVWARRKYKVDGGIEDLKSQLPDLPREVILRAEWEERFSRMYEAYNPEGVGSVPLLLEASKGQEQVMMDAMIAKYGPEPVKILQEGFLTVGAVSTEGDAADRASSLESSTLRGKWTDNDSRHQVLRHAKNTMTPLIQLGLVKKSTAKDIISSAAAKYFSESQDWSQDSKKTLETLLFQTAKQRLQPPTLPASHEDISGVQATLLNYICEGKGIRDAVVEGEDPSSSIVEYFMASLGSAEERERFLTVLAKKAVGDHLRKNVACSSPTHRSSSRSPSPSPSPPAPFKVGEKVFVTGTGPGLILETSPYVRASYLVVSLDSGGTMTVDSGSVRSIHAVSQPRPSQPRSPENQEFGHL